MRIFLIIFGLAILAVVSIFGFRGAKSEKPPLEVFPDMDRQARFGAQRENTFFADGRDARPIPDNTVARGNYLNYAKVFSPEFEDGAVGDSVYLYGKNPDGSFHDGIPLEVDNELMAYGQKKYDIFCASCHGASGDGNGVTKDYGVLAASYHNDRLRNIEDGYIYDVITNGKGLMYGLKDRLNPKERWAIVLYLRALQRSQNASAESLPEAKQKELGI